MRQAKTQCPRLARGHWLVSGKMDGMTVGTIGITTGEHAFHGIMTFCTCGLWLPVWLLRALLARRAVRP